jgi:hypothetical protein
MKGSIRRSGKAPLAQALLVCVVACLLASGCATGDTKHRGVPVQASQHQPAVPAVYGSPNGVVARWVVDENNKPGSSSWQIPPSLYDKAPQIFGYSDVTGATWGDRVTMYVETAAPSFHVEAYRMGYYQGLGARLVWRSSETPSVAQPACTLTPGVFMVYCPWRPSLSFTVTRAFPEGDYLLKLVAEGGGESYVPLTVWNPNSHATYLIDNSVFTWQAWNNWGGYDMYGGNPPGVTPSYDNRARVMSFDRPYGTGEGAGDFLGNEYPLIRLMEKDGLDVSYVNDVLFSEHPSVILQHKVYLSLGHAECWDNNERNAAVRALGAGINFVFFGASPILRHVRLQPGPTGQPDREMVDYRDPTQDPLYGKDNALVTANTWAAPPTNLPAAQIVGDTYGGYGIDAPMIVVDASSWVFAGTGLSNGASLPHVVKFDYDRYVPGIAGEPDNVEILAHSPVVTSYGHHDYADMTYYTSPYSGAGVLATGTNFFIPSLSPCSSTPPGQVCPAPFLRKIVENVMAAFGAGPAGRTHPSSANWRSFYQ